MESVVSEDPQQQQQQHEPQQQDEPQQQQEKTQQQQEQQQEQQQQQELAVEIPQNLPDPSKRRKSATVAQDQAGCYLVYDQEKARWAAVWSPSFVAAAAAILNPSTKVPPYKYSKREKVILEAEKNKDAKSNFLAGLCLFFKLIRDYKGTFTLLPAAEEVELKDVAIVGLKGQEVFK
ncbi:hypothetical protein, conserved [Eimeria tenella]|uniref:Immune mapped protein 2 N-terminal domain-containing protein n=1 Tax=Eimeria tenella TaxID=5802 RepID=U6KHT9_EIMTE|nr:hypothetical protein, conserved [Eimeria tenella]CDJ37504.1 hypothetical protein, conserved [Eimeria tenella]|eukprot:XP_013228342.1 hypothetical protein, conserved [Eimeria tenella]